jgi:hypothetical protein
MANVHDLDRLADNVVVDFVDVGIFAVEQWPNNVSLSGKPGS